MAEVDLRTILVDMDIVFDKITIGEAMPQLNINIEVRNKEGYTVRDMRRKLAQVLSSMSGDHKVSFSFQATIGEYKPNENRS